ncbi:ribose-5-phosphate isomerase rki1, variant 2 [Orbilia ellipsospora]|uniref:Ribose-5-phosphate isomerase rki1, variant 2 n=1 Tax=Orbilia ellipsospora TaxID=2528407 RepID=A0AAV9WXT4_9PEZI
MFNPLSPTVKDSKTKAHKDPSSEQNDEDWKAVLRAVLLADAQPEDLHLLSNIQISALVKKDGISISVREDVGGIRRRLGILQLSPQEVEIELWDWLDRACKEKDDAEARAHKAEKAEVEIRTRLEKLEKQVQELTLAKKKHEDGLILQFQRLLNEKKQKIRELSGGDRKITDAIKPSRQREENYGASEKVATLTGRKRKQGDKPHSETDDDASDKMAIDQHNYNDNNNNGESDGLDVDDASDRMEGVDPDAEERNTTDDEATLDEATDDDEEL